VDHHVQVPARHPHEDAARRMAPFDPATRQGYAAKQRWALRFARQT
jgi:hypothetical protein